MEALNPRSVRQSQNANISSKNGRVSTTKNLRWNPLILIVAILTFLIGIGMLYHHIISFEESDDFLQSNLRATDLLNEKIIAKEIEEGLDQFELNNEKDHSKFMSVDSGQEYGKLGSVIEPSRKFGARFNVLLSGNSTSNDNCVELTFDIHPKWAPLGANRFHELVLAKYFDDSRFFRVIKKFVAQFGIAGNPNITKSWSSKRIVDDPVIQGNSIGTLVFATSGKDTRTTQMFINLNDNRYLDKEGFAAIGIITSGQDHLSKIFAGYGEGGRGDGKDGRGPAQGRANNFGNVYLDSYFPQLGRIVSIVIEQDNIKTV